MGSDPVIREEVWIYSVGSGERLKQRRETITFVFNKDDPGIIVWVGLEKE